MMSRLCGNLFFQTLLQRLAIELGNGVLEVRMLHLFQLPSCFRVLPALAFRFGFGFRFTLCACKRPFLMELVARNS